MAIDTEDKRRSTHGIGFYRVLPVPDGTIGDADRAHIFIYSGISIGAAVLTFAPGGGFNPMIYDMLIEKGIIVILWIFM